ncbi:GNAT family N-acetyltransferase [Planococcus shenhongbingii]
MASALQKKVQEINTMEMRFSRMLIRYKKSCEKIAMGLLSFMPGEKDLKKLKQTIQKYEENADCHLYLWRKGDDFIGLIGVELEDSHFTVHHISVMPSYRGEGIGRAMVEKIQQILEPREIRASEETKEFVEMCRKVKKSNH